MCGIVGYIGKQTALDIVISGLRRLEYRGYDSAGVALVSPESKTVSIAKCTGKIETLNRLVQSELANSAAGKATLGIGHTRWATHGEPTQINAHPHLSQNGTVAVVHNGIIDNYAPLKQRLQQDGVEFKSDTDTEVIAHLIEKCYDGDLRAAVATALEKLEGTYGIAVISPLHPDTLIAARKGSPIVIGVCDDETIVASDISAIASYTRQVVYLDDGDLLMATRDRFEITSSKNAPVSRPETHIDWDVDEIEKGGYEHFMLKEINEQPSALANTLRGRTIPDEGTTKLNGLQMTPMEIATIDRISIAACGTSYHAGMVGKYFFEEFACIPTEIEQAAEFRDRNPIVQRNTCLLAVSQSGETADTLAAVREGLRKGATVLGICNVVGSTIARECGRGVYLHAGPEIGVASTKAFTCQVTVLAMMAILLGRTRRLSSYQGSELVKDIAGIPELAKRVLEQDDHIREVAARYVDKEDFFFIGRGYMYPTALEGALKLKEISYVHAEGYHAAELKHGPLALLTPEVPVVVAVPDIPGKTKTIANMQECKARKSPVIAIATEGDESIVQHSSDIITIPPCSAFVSPIPAVIAMQLFAYHIANLRGCEIDQPRNLAKSVTVE